MRFDAQRVNAILLASLVLASCGGSARDSTGEAMGGGAPGVDSGVGSGGTETNGSGGAVAGGSGNAAGAPTETGGTNGAGGVSGTGGRAVGGTAGEQDAGVSESCYEGNACAVEGDWCSPPECCPCDYECRDGVWRVSSCPRCPMPVCPDPPMSGTPCGACDELVSPCVYDECDSGGRITAVCEDGTWNVAAEACPAQCGEDGPCEPGFVCVRQSAWTMSATCQPNPCEDQPLSCDCAASLCTIGACTNAGEGMVDCVCLAC